MDFERQISRLLFGVFWLYLYCISSLMRQSQCFDLGNINLPISHIPYFFTNNPDVKFVCERDETCPYLDLLEQEKCWGYEASQCLPQKRLRLHDCSGDSRSWANSKDEQINHFWRNADFGVVQERRREMTVMCRSVSPDDSSLKCSSNLRYCEAKNIFIDLRTANINNMSERNRYREDILGPGKVGGHCELDAASLKSQGDHKSPLQSWFAELEHFTSLEFYPSKGENCDIIYDKPTYLIKLDAGINMYHHFCDFVNLYVSQHVNNSFNTDINIVVWDTSIMPYRDFFSVTWKAFTDNPIIYLKDLDGKRVCFKDAVFPLLARQMLGLYYNMPVMPGCSGSSLFQAFHEHIIHRLAIPQEGPLEDKIRITLLVRSTQYRKILNQDELSAALKSIGEYEVTVVDYDWLMPFEDQLRITYNSDIFIGMHGSGLTHLMFQPDWGVIFELYNCEDSNCYYDLARLRGIRYQTWERGDKLTQEDEGHHPTLGAHAKFTNYAFDTEEFMRLIFKSAEYVKSHPTFIKARAEKQSTATPSPETPRAEL